MAHKIALREVAVQPHPIGRAPKPIFAFTASEEGFLVIRCSVVSGNPDVVRNGSNYVVSNDFEETTTAKLRLETSNDEFRENLAHLLDHIRGDVIKEMASQHGTAAAGVNRDAQSKEPAQSTHINVTIYRQKAGKKAWQSAVHEVTPATHIAISIPLDMPDSHAKSKLDSFLSSVRRVASREKGCSPT